MNYTTFTADDFARDDFFIRWVVLEDVDAEKFWTAWMIENPLKRAEIAKAREIVSSIKFDKNNPSPQEVRNMWENINKAVAEEENVLEDSVPTYPLWRTIAKVAAGLVLLLVAGISFFYLGRNDLSVHATKFGEIKTVNLPDGSKVTLNANSKISFNKSLDSDSERKVWLEGEAFFSVKRNAAKTKFLVYTSLVKVEVLGTKFNVNSRRGKARVVLNSGKVALDVGGKTEEKIIMAPGEMIEFNRQDNEIKKRNVDAATFSMWRESKLVFQDTPLKQISEVLRDTYGLEVIFKDKSLDSLTFSGSTSAHRVDLLLLKISKSFNLKFKRNENTIIFENP